MWVWATSGFVSAVQHRDNHDNLMVRARDRSSLEYMLESIQLAGKALAEDGSSTTVDQDLEIVTSPKGDYRHRVVMSKSTFALYLQFEVLNYINYPNFKSELAKVRGPEFTSAAHSVWTTMHKVSDGTQVYGTVGLGGARIAPKYKPSKPGLYGGTGENWVGSSFFGSELEPDSELVEHDEVDADGEWHGDLPEGAEDWEDAKFEAYLDFLAEEHDADVKFEDWYEDLMKAEAAYKLSGGLSAQVPVTEIAKTATSEVA